MLRAATFFLLFSASLCAQSLRVGSLNLEPCHYASHYCGSIPRPLDPAGQVPGTIAIGFQFFPARHANQPAAGTIVAVEGGPGFATTGSAGGYVVLFDPLLDDHNLLLVDNRGTGASGAIDCEPLQSELVQTVSDVGSCGAQLGDRSDLYGTALAADDLAAVLDTLQTGPIDLYGDSYGTWFSQSFAVRYPDQVRSVILDSAYPVLGESPFYPFAAAYNRLNYDLVCERSLSCHDLPGTSEGRIEAALNALRAHPFSGAAYDGNGNLRTVIADPTALTYAMFAGTMGPVIYRDLDAAARAYTTQGDTAPLLRLFAENDLTSGFEVSGGRAADYSRGLFAAVSCSDYPQIYDMTAPPQIRAVQDQQSIKAAEQSVPGIYAPFTIGEFRAMSIDVSLLDLCATWPVPAAAHPPQHSVPPGAIFPATPVLVLSGELDALTTPTEGKLTTDLFPNAKQVIVANSFHVTAVVDPDHCASQIAVFFVRNLTPGDTSCAAQIAEVRTVPDFVTLLAGVTGAEPAAGNVGTPRDLQAAAAAALAVGDAVARWYVNTSGSGVGLRGGTFSYSSQFGTFHYVLSSVSWVTDEAVSGEIDWDFLNGSVTASVNISGAGTEAGALLITYDDRQPHAKATISGAIGGRAIAATMIAP